MRGAAEEVKREVNLILQELAIAGVGDEIVDSAYLRVQPDPAPAQQDRIKQRVALIEAARDLSVAYLLDLARDDTNPRQDRGACLLLRFYEPQIRGAVRQRIRNAHDCDCVVNRVRQKILSYLGRLRGGRVQLHCIIERACEHACTDHFRRIPEGEMLCPPHLLRGPYLDDSRAQSAVELKLFLRDNLCRLSCNEQQAVKAFLTYGGNWAEAGRALNVSRQTLDSRFRTAVRHLRSYVDE